MNEFPYRRRDPKLRQIVDEILSSAGSVADKAAAMCDAGVPLSRALALLGRN